MAGSPVVVCLRPEEDLSSFGVTVPTTLGTLGLINRPEDTGGVDDPTDPVRRIMRTRFVSLLVPPPPSGLSEVETRSV